MVSLPHRVRALELAVDELRAALGAPAQPRPRSLAGDLVRTFLEGLPPGTYRAGELYRRFTAICPGSGVSPRLFALRALDSGLVTRRIDARGRAYVRGPVAAGPRELAGGAGAGPGPIRRWLVHEMGEHEGAVIAAHSEADALVGGAEALGLPAGALVAELESTGRIETWAASPKAAPERIAEEAGVRWSVAEDGRVVAGDEEVGRG